MQVKAVRAEDILTKIDELPTLPTIVYELSQAINNPMSSTSDVEAIMGNDQSLTTKVLKLVNSAYYAIPGGVSSVSRAIAYLGFDTVNQLVLSTSIIQALEMKGPSRFDLNEFWKHSLGVAIASETIAKFIRHPMPSDVFTCGLLHDMGKVALYSISADSLISIVEHATKNGLSYSEAEEEFSTPKHTTIGALLSQRWHLPSSIHSAVKNHHQIDPNLRGGLTPDLNQSVDITFLANLFIHALKFGNSGHNKIIGAPREVMKRLTIDPEKDFKRLLVIVKQNLDRTADFLRILGGT